MPDFKIPEEPEYIERIRMFEAEDEAHADLFNAVVQALVNNDAFLKRVAGEKVDKVPGKGLSTNDFTTTLKNKLAGIATGAEVNVQADWNETNTSSDAYIKNKPTIPEGVAVDSALSSTSENPVQNKVVYTELGKKANLASPTFTGAPKAPTPASTENSTRLATTAYVKAVVNALVDGAPETLDTLKEVADAIAEHREVTDALNAAIGNKVDKVSGKGLSTNDFTTALKNKLSGIATGAEVNVQADWEETNASSDAYIKNKPLYSGKPKAGTSEDSYGYVAYPSDGGINITSGTGYLRITLPVSWVNAKIKFVVSIFESKAGGSADYFISGYLHPSAETWMNCTAVCVGELGAAKANLPVTFGHDGEKCAITIGDSDTTWSFACAQVHDIIFANTSADLAEFASGWAVGVSPEALPDKDATVTYTNIGTEYALKAVYGNTSINLGRRAGSAAGGHSLAFGENLTVSGEMSAAIGSGNVVGTKNSFASGKNNSMASTDGTDHSNHVEGAENELLNSSGSHVEGTGNTTKNNDVLHLEGRNNSTENFHTSHVEGDGNTITSDDAHVNSCAHVEGYGNTMSFDLGSTPGDEYQSLADYFASYSHMEGLQNHMSNGLASHIEGYSNNITQECLEGEGERVWTRSAYAHVEGRDNTVYNYCTHMEGRSNESHGIICHVQGLGNQANSDYVSVIGRYNKKTTGDINLWNYAKQDIGDAFVIGNGTNAFRSNAMRVTYLGDILGTKAFQSSGADYAEFIKPWADGNPDNEDRVGYFVTVKDGLLHKASAGDYIAGITSGNPSVVGNADEDYYWRYERDEFNRIIMEDVPETVQAKDDDGNPLYDKETHEPVMVETGNTIKNARMKLAEGYDPSLQESYVPRAERKEWDYVGMVGALPVRDDGTCVPGRFCKCGQGGIATLAEERGFDTFYVLERISGNVVSVELRG